MFQRMSSNEIHNSCIVENSSQECVELCIQESHRWICLWPFQETKSQLKMVTIVTYYHNNEVSMTCMKTFNTKIEQHDILVVVWLLPWQQEVWCHLMSFLVSMTTSPSIVQLIVVAFVTYNNGLKFYWEHRKLFYFLNVPFRVLIVCSWNKI